MQTNTNLVKEVYLPIYEKIKQVYQGSKEDSVIKKALQFFSLYDSFYQAGKLSFKKRHFFKNDKAASPVEISQVFFQLAQNIYKDKEQEHAFLYAKSIYKFLMTPVRANLEQSYATSWFNSFDTLNQLNEVKTIETKFSRWLYRHQPQRQKFKDLKELDQESQASIKIQRAYRQFYYKKNKKLKFLEPIFPLTYTYSLSINVKTPSKSNAINKIKAQQWINCHSSQKQETAKKVIKGLVHRSFAKFDKQLQKTIEDFNLKLMSYSEKDRSYVLVIPETNKGKSNEWVSSLAFKYLAIFPSDIISGENLLTYSQIFNKEYQILMIDDAAYSGRQMEKFIEKLKNKNICWKRLHLAIPFITKSAFNRLAYSSHSSQIEILNHERMLNIPELNLFTTEELEDMAKAYINNARQWNELTLTYFDHKIADYYSTLPEILKYGYTVEGKRSPFTFIPATIPPYKINSEREND